MDPFLELALIFVTAKLSGYLSSRVGLPAAMGQILGGIIIGASFLDLVAYDEGVRLISDIGVVMLLFLAGLETDIEEFRRVGFLPLWLLPLVS